MVLSKTLLTSMAGVLLLATAPAFADYVVTTDSDADDGGDGHCSLREAIIAVNSQADYHECTSSNVGESFVSFAIAPDLGEVHEIQLGAALPTVTHFIGIDGTTQSGTSCAPTPNVRVQITNPSALAIDGIVLDAGSATSDVRGLAISGFASSEQAGLRIESNDAKVGCVLAGTDASGSTAQPNYYGIYVNGQAARIGVATPTEWRPNLLSGNSKANVFVNTGGADTVISGNYIGPDSSGITALPSSFGIYAQGVAGLRIGYADSTTPSERQRNIIGVSSPPAASSSEVEFDNTIDSAISGNYIGVGGDGATVLPMTSGIGVIVFQSSSTLVGCDGIAAPTDCRNVIANPAGVAVEAFEGSSNTAVVGNYLGIAADGMTVLSGSTSTVGINMNGTDVLVARNVITSGGLGTGIALTAGSTNQTPVFLNQSTAGSGGATLDSSDNCVQGNATAGVATNMDANTTVLSTTFIGNWWGAADGPAPNGSGDSAANNVVFEPFLTQQSSGCGLDHVFADGFE
jgi:CSLREA domain-containing protein